MGRTNGEHVVDTRESHGRGRRADSAVSTSAASHSATTEKLGAAASQATSTPRVIDLLRKYTPRFMSWYDAPQQVKSVLSKILLCRTSLVPGGGPALDGGGWITSRHPTQRNRRKPFLVDHVLLGQTFREKFADGFRRLVRAGKLRLEDEWAQLLEPDELEAWLNEVTESDWNVFIEGPPHGKSRPEHVLKYLARYMSGGPISDRRIIADEHDHVTFWGAAKTRRRAIHLGRSRFRARNSFVAGRCTFCPRATPARANSAATTAANARIICLAAGNC